MTQSYFSSIKILLQIQSELRRWFSVHGLKYPWRSNRLSSFEIVITECLLQRTRSETVAKYWSIFFEAVPNWESLITIDTQKLRQILKPFGLVNIRSHQLVDLAWDVLDRNERLPKDDDGLREMPGIGQYISNVVRVTIYHDRAPFLDVNFARVVERLFGPRRLADIRYDPKLQQIAACIVDTDDSLILNWAILDLAKLICRKTNPKCHECPINKFCLYYSTMQK